MGNVYKHLIYTWLLVYVSSFTVLFHDGGLSFSNEQMSARGFVPE